MYAYFRGAPRTAEVGSDHSRALPVVRIIDRVTATKWATAVRGLVGAYRVAMLGKLPLIVPAAAAPLAGVALNPNGSWRDPHPLVTVREFMSEAVDAYVNNVTASRRVNRQTAASVVRLVWGIDGHPLSVAEAQERLELGLAPRAGERWAQQICYDKAVQDYAASVAARNRPPRTVPREGASPNSLFLADSLPAHAVRQARERLLLDQDPRTRRLPLAEQDEHLKQVVLHLTGERVDHWFGKGKKHEREGHLRWFMAEAASRWFPSQTPLLAPPLGIAKPAGDDYANAISAAVTVCMHLAVADTDALKASLNMRLSLATMPSVVRNYTMIFDRVTRQLAHERQISDAELAAQRTLTILVPPKGMVFDGPATTATGLMNIAAMCRKASSFDVALARHLIEQYLARRPVVLERPQSQQDQVLVTLADHSLHWDTIVLEQRDLERRVRTAIRTQRTSARLAYMTHTHRAPALLANKDGKWPEATAHTVTGLRELVAMFGHGVVEDRDEFLGAAEQLWLAMAGISIRKMEWLLGRGSTASRRPVAAQACRTALAASGSALECLEVLDGTDTLHPELGTGLPASRHDRGRIDSKVWWIRALIIRLRALLGVQTVVGARLANRPYIFANAGTSDPFTLVSLDARRIDDEHLSIDYIRELYTTLITQPGLAAALQQEVVALALWLALIDDQKIPVHPRIAPALAGLTFLTQQDADQRRRSLDVVAVVNWLSRMEDGFQPVSVIAYDAWALSWLPKTAPAYKWLDTVSHGMYAHFRLMHNERRPAKPSHD